MLAFCYVVVNIAHLLLVSKDNAEWYFLSASLFDMLVLTIVSRINIPQTDSIQMLCIMSVIVNGAGWLLWDNEIDLTAYAAVQIAIYLYAIFILTSRDKSDVGDHSEYGNGVVFLGNSAAVVKRIFDHKG